MVHYFELVLHKVRGKMKPWREILAIPYQEYLMSK